MPPGKERSREFRREQVARDRKRQPAAVRADRLPKSEAYARNKRSASKVAVRDWQNW